MTDVTAPDEVDLVIYHGNCWDGFTSAWCAWLRRGDACEYVPGIYGEPPPDVRGRKVAILDYSYKRSVLEQIAAQADALIVLDHHKTAQQDLEGLAYARFDMERSGAGLAAEFFEAPKWTRLFVDYVQDRDLWHWALPDSHEINEALKLVPYEFNSWSVFAQYVHDLGMREDLVTQGSALLAMTKQHLDMLAKTAVKGLLVSHPCWFANAPYGFASELGNVLAERGDPDIAAIWRCDYSRSGKIGISLRASASSTVDVSELAAKFGGGGHKKAAGFELPISRISEIVACDIWRHPMR